MFTAGVEAEDEQTRSLILGRIKSLEGVGMMQVGRARTLMEKVWETGQDWETLAQGEFFLNKSFIGIITELLRSTTVRRDTQTSPDSRPEAAPSAVRPTMLGHEELNWENSFLNRHHCKKKPPKIGGFDFPWPPFGPHLRTSIWIVDSIAIFRILRNW